ncbi:MAG: ATP-binding cassette domain-containing protein [Salaquimonas sp.]|jgi:putative thiamine transport system ATP-binding protein|nr:ATP-binding cassette domain-containing protein [Salaquimonas sp.]
MSLELDHISIRLAGRELISLTASIGPGEVLTVMGPSGSGKSTLLAFVAGFLDPAFSASGTVRLDGQDISQLPANLRRTAMLFQDPMLFPHMSVGENLLFAVRAGKNQGTERRQLAEAALDEAGLTGFFGRDPATLSGGQKARAALMRVLLSQPKALLLDEPFSKLDTDRRSKIRDFVFEEAKQRRLPVLLVTHDAADADSAGGQVVTLG